ncbi:MAG: hypothetical protein IPP72_16285 [Chitinophagaceae bacterium]|nr:hypothetical protein [Chitinophagaceae bacterium]
MLNEHQNKNMFLLSKSVKFLLSTILVIGLITLFGRKTFFAVILQPWIWVYSLFFVLIGLFLGLCIFLWREKEATKNLCYNIGLSVSCICGILLITFFAIYPHLFTPEKGNVEKNRDFLNFKPPTVNGNHLQIAYKYFIKQFGDENEIELKGCNVDTDSLIYLKTIYRFKYSEKKDTTIYVSKVQMLDTIPSILYLKRVANKDLETVESDKKSLNAARSIMKRLDSFINK